MPKAVRETDVVQRLLDDRGWTQRDLAERLQVDEKTVSRWMTGATNLTERRLRKAFATLRIDPTPYGLEPITGPTTNVATTNYDALVERLTQMGETKAPPQWFVDYQLKQFEELREIRELLEVLVNRR